MLEDVKLSTGKDKVADQLNNMFSVICCWPPLYVDLSTGLNILSTVLPHSSIDVQIFELTCRPIRRSCRPAHYIQLLTASVSTTLKCSLHLQRDDFKYRLSNLYKYKSRGDFKLLKWSIYKLPSAHQLLCSISAINLFAFKAFVLFV